MNIKPLDNNDRVNALSLGKKEFTALKIFLKKSALDFHQHNIAKTYVLVDEEKSPRVWGYFVNV